LAKVWIVVIKRVFTYKSPGENGGEEDAQKDLHSRTGRDETKRKTQERMERRSRKRSSSFGGEKVEKVGDR
jgi:hypothetical protein